MSLPWRLVAATAVAPMLVVGVAVLPGLASTDSEAEEAVTTSALLVSGRDDHGLIQSHVVQLSARADGTGDAGQLHDGTLVELLEVKDRAHRVRSGD